MFYRLKNRDTPLFLLIGAAVLAVLFVVIRYWNLLAR